MLTRPFCRTALAVVLCLAQPGCSKGLHGNGRDEAALCAGCNVVLISMDTVRADHLGTYGYPLPTSPHVDAFARRSVVFKRAISQTAWTLPAHGSMMTGLYPTRLGVARYPAARPLPDVPTLAEAFREAGYRTAAFTGGGFVSAHFGFGRGFERYESHGRRFEHNLQATLKWLAEHRGERFFLFVHGYDAHRPYHAEPADRRAVGLTGKRPTELRGFCVRGKREKPPNLADIVRQYDAAIHHGDRAVGAILDALNKHGLLDRTVVLITADHGEEFFEHGNCDHVRFLYGEVVHVPYILYVPALAEKRLRIQEIVPASISVARTLLELAGIEREMPGVSLVPLLRGERHVFGAVFSETDSPIGRLGSRGATIAMTTDRDKLISYTEEGTDEGYDLVRDPMEQHVLPEGHPVYEKRATLRAWKRSLVPLPRGGAAPGKARGRPGEQLPERLRESLRSLGYLE